MVGIVLIISFIIYYMQQMASPLNVAVQFLKKLTENCVEDCSLTLLSQIVQKAEEIDSLCLETAYKDEARQLLSECSTVKALTKVLQILNDSRYRLEYNPALFDLCKTCASLSYRFKEFCEGLCKFGFVAFLIELIWSSKEIQPLSLVSECGWQP